MKVNEGAIYLLSFYVSHNVHTIVAIIVLYKMCHFDDSLKMCHYLFSHIWALIMLNPLIVFSPMQVLLNPRTVSPMWMT